MHSDLSALDLATITAVQGVIVAALRDQCCQWEQESADAVAEGRLSNAVMVQNWAFAANLLASKVSTEFSVLFGKALDARFGEMTSTTHRSVAGQVMDALTLEVAAAQEEPELVTA
jgi:hypothetical protein